MRRGALERPRPIASRPEPTEPTLRIIAGHARGRRLVAPRGLATRPTTDRVREAIFSMITTRMDLEGARVLDLFAGTGALGCEALSRGAQSALFIDRSREAERAIRDNLGRIDGRGEVRQGAVERLVATLAGPFDLVLLDPPYGDHAVGPTLLRLLERPALLAEGALVVAEHGGDEPLPGSGELAPLALVTTRRYGDTHVTIWQHLAAASQEET